jgi:hypothetical protein
MDKSLVKKTSCILKRLIHGTCEKSKKEENKKREKCMEFF